MVIYTKNKNNNIIGSRVVRGGGGGGGARNMKYKAPQMGPSEGGMVPLPPTPGFAAEQNNKKAIWISIAGMSKCAHTRGGGGGR